MRQLEADHSCGPEIESEYELGWLLYREIGRLLATQNAIDVLGGVRITGRYIGTVRDKPTRIRIPYRVDCRQAMPQCQRNDEIAIHVGHGMREDNKPTVPLHRECGNGAFDFRSIVDASGSHLHSEMQRAILD